MRMIGWIGLAVGFFVAGIARGAVLVSAPFANSQQVAQHWLTGGPAADAIVSNSALVLVNIPNGATRGALTYLTARGQPLHLQPGAELTLTFHYTFGQTDPSDWGLMFGFFDSGGKRASRMDGSYNQAIFEAYRGYVGVGVLGATKAERFKVARRIRPANNLISSAAYETLGTPQAQSGGSLPTRTYAASLRLVCDAPGHLILTATIDRQSLVSQDAAALTDVDSLGVFVTRHPLQFTIQDLAVNYEPDGGGKKTAAPSRARP